MKFFLLVLCPFFLLYGNYDYTEYWQRLRWSMWDNGTVSLGSYIDLRTQDKCRNFRLLQLSEQMQFKAAENVFFSLNYSYIHSRSVVPHSLWHWDHRLEIELNRDFLLSDIGHIETRNRLEVRRLKTEPNIQFRFRQRTMLVLPLKNKASLKEFRFYNEVFYDLSNQIVSQDRFCPLSFIFQLSDDSDLELFFLITFFIHNDIWRRAAVFGTQINF